MLSIASLGFTVAATVVLLNWPALGGPGGFANVPLHTTPIWIFGTLGVVLLWFRFVFDGSSADLAFRAVADDERTAAATGINVTATKVLAFALGAAIAGLGGALYVHRYGAILPADLGFSPSLTYLIYVAVGGTTTFWGPIVGSAILVTLPELLRFSLSGRYIIYGLALVLVVMLRPGGLIRRRPAGLRALGLPGRLLRPKPPS
jgi:branched-chain amino acid transport system permease protein